MKLFALDRRQERVFKRLVLWHLAYLLLISLFFGFIYYFGYFKTHPLLKESPIFMFIAPFSTFVFVLVSPWRKNWRGAIKDTLYRLEGEPAFCVMGAVVFIIGFYFYSVLLWGLGALIPSVFYM